MLDIEGIKQKVNEIVTLNEGTEYYRQVDGLHNIFRPNQVWREIYNNHGGDYYEGDLRKKCNVWAQNEEYMLDDDQDDHDYIKVGDTYYDFDKVWDSWKEFCMSLDKNDGTEPDTEGDELNETYDSSDNWMNKKIKPGENKLYQFTDYDLEIKSDSKEKYELTIFKKDSGNVLEWEEFSSWDELVNFVKNYCGDEEPLNDGSELDETVSSQRTEKDKILTGLDNVLHHFTEKDVERIAENDDDQEDYLIRNAILNLLFTMKQIVLLNDDILSKNADEKYKGLVEFIRGITLDTGDDEYDSSDPTNPQPGQIDWQIDHMGIDDVLNVYLEVRKECESLVSMYNDEKISVEPEDEGDELNESRWDYIEPDYFEPRQPEAYEEKEYKKDPFLFNVEYNNEEDGGDLKFIVTTYKKPDPAVRTRTEYPYEEVEVKTFDLWDDVVNYMKDTFENENTKKRSEPDTDGDELNESEEEVEPYWLKNPIGTDEYETHRYEGYDFSILCSYNSNDNEFYYNLYVREVGSDKVKYDIEFEDWEDLRFFVKKCVKDGIKNMKEPETEGDELNESLDYDKLQDLKVEISDYIESLDVNEYGKVTEYGVTMEIRHDRCDEYWDDECGRDRDEIYYACILDDNVGGTKDGYGFYYPEEIADFFIDYLLEHEKDIDEDTLKEPESDGNELDETVESDDWKNNPPEGDSQKVIYYKNFQIKIWNCGIKDEPPYYWVWIYPNSSQRDYHDLLWNFNTHDWNTTITNIEQFVKENNDKWNEPNEDGNELNESKLDVKSIKNKIDEIIRLNEGLEKRNIEPFVIMPIIVFTPEEWRNSYISNNISTERLPLYARFANYEGINLNDEINAGLNPELARIVAQYDSYQQVYKVGVMYEDEDNTLAMVLGFHDNGEYYMDNEDQPYSYEEGAEEMNKILQRMIDRAREKMSELQINYGGKLVKGEYYYASDKQKPLEEPDTDGDELDETVTPLNKTDYEFEKVKIEEYADTLNVNEYGGYKLNNISFEITRDSDTEYHVCAMDDNIGGTDDSGQLYSSAEVAEYIVNYVKEHTNLIKFVDYKDNFIGRELVLSADSSRWKIKDIFCHNEKPYEEYFKLENIDDGKTYFAKPDEMKQYFDIDVYNMLGDDFIFASEPESEGDELNESVLMERSGSSSFTVEPCIVCDTEYPKDDEGNVLEDEYAWTPFEDYLDRNDRLPPWIYTSRQYDYIGMPALNKTLNDELVYIVGLPGYYDGLTVGILARDVDEIRYEILENVKYNVELEEDPESHDIVRWYIDGNGNRYTEKEVNEEAQALLDKELEKARHILLEAQQGEGGKIVPESYSIKEPDTEGDELNESVFDDVENITPPPCFDEKTYRFGDYVYIIKHTKPIQSHEIYIVLVFGTHDNKTKKEHEKTFRKWDDCVKYIKKLYYRDETEPNSEGDELDERFDMKTIKKQINEIVEKANG